MTIEELGRRAVACRHWKWLPGMSVLRYAPGTPAHGQRKARVDDEFVTYEQALSVHIIPDLSDPATLGCLLHLVQAAWNAARISLCFSAYTPNQGHAWAIPITYLNEHVGSGDGYTHVPAFYGRTQGDALVAALEAAP